MQPPLDYAPRDPIDSLRRDIARDKMVELAREGDGPGPDDLDVFVAHARGARREKFVTIAISCALAAGLAGFGATLIFWRLS